MKHNPAVFIVEDNEEHLASLRSKIALLGYETIGTCRSSIGALDKIKKAGPDIVLLDINLHGDNEGIHLANKIGQSCNASIIFVTASSSDQILKEAVSCNPSGYLVKPVNLGDLKASIELGLYRKKNPKILYETSHSEEHKGAHVTVRVGHKLKKVELEDIKIVRTEAKNYVTLITKDDHRFSVRSSLKAICKDVLPSHFLQIHRLHAINMNHLQSISEKEQLVFMANKIHLPIGKTYKKNLYQRLNLI